MCRRFAGLASHRAAARTSDRGCVMTKRPNFLFLITDQQRADWLSCYGRPVLKTPNIDKIAAYGTRFDNFHAASPVCMPNRASLLTRRYPSLHGLRYNGCSLPKTANTFVDVLASAGYHTARTTVRKTHPSSQSTTSGNQSRYPTKC